MPEQENWILLRGWIRHHGHWFGFDEALARHKQAFNVEKSIWVHPIDLLGNGNFSSASSPRNIQLQAEHVRTQIAAVDKGGDIVIVALSLASLVALSVLYPTQSLDWRMRVKGLVLVNPSVRGESHLWHRLQPRAWPVVIKRLIYLNPRQLEQDLVKLTVNTQSLWPAVISHNQMLLETHPLSRVNALNQLFSAARFSVNGYPKRFPVPILILCGLRDKLVDWSSGARLARRLGALIRLHPSGGHDLTTDAPEWTLAQISQWLDSLENSV